MSTNIKHEAVYPPAVFGLRRMSHQSPPRNNSKGSYELYDSQQSAADAFVDKKVNGISGTAPGSPGSAQDYRQLVVSLQRELEESKRKSSELQQIIAGMTIPQAQSSASLVDGQLLDDSSSSDSLGENVKDAHIKHLQREVALLKANLYKPDGWANRLANAIKERDKALDDVTRLTNDVKNIYGDKEQLAQKVKELTTACEETQHKLHLVTQELQNQMRNSQIMIQLKEETQRQRTEITNLKESLSRLDHENRSLKDSYSGSVSQSLSSVPCRPELDHLHLVVEKLKATVLDQREYLLNLKKPVASRYGQQQSTSPSPANIGSLMPQDSSSGSIKLSSPTFNAQTSSAGGDGGNHQQQLAFCHLNQAVGLKSAILQESFFDSRLNNYNSPDFGKEVGTSGRRKPYTQDNSEDVFNLDDLNSPQPLNLQGENFIGLKPGPVLKAGGSLYNVSDQKSPDMFRKQGSGDQKAGQAVKSSPGYDLTKSPQQRTTQSEVLGYRNGFGNATSQEHWGAKSEIIGRQAWHLNQASSNKSPAQAYKSPVPETDNFTKLSPGHAVNQRYPMSRSLHQEVDDNGYKGNFLPTESQRQFVFDEGNMHIIGDSSAVEYENVNLNSPTCHPHQIYHPPTSSQEAATQDMMAGAKLGMPAPSAHQTSYRGTGRDVVYVNTPSDHCLGSSTTGDVDPPRANVKSDKSCPVCSNDFSHVSIEEFQTHVYECFDDENAPETMRPQATSEKLCPVCNDRFGPDTTQVEYEKHVYGHFGEDCPGENFVILQS